MDQHEKREKAREASKKEGIAYEDNPRPQTTRTSTHYYYYSLPLLLIIFVEPVMDQTSPYWEKERERRSWSLHAWFPMLSSRIELPEQRYQSGRGGLTWSMVKISRLLDHVEAMAYLSLPCNIHGRRWGGQNHVWEISTDSLARGHFLFFCFRKRGLIAGLCAACAFYFLRGWCMDVPWLGWGRMYVFITIIQNRPCHVGF